MRYWDIQEFTPENRAEAVREVIANITGRVDIDFPTRGRQVQASSASIRSTTADRVHGPVERNPGAAHHAICQG